jgi:dTDP-4-dehydrorhamnose reductase
MKILIFGRDGQVGRALQGDAARRGEITTLGRAGADFTTPAAIAALVLAERPAVIINAAAYTAVDKAESEPDLAMAINAEAPARMAEAAAAINALFVHYSTDYVFDGTKPGPYVETDTPAPLSVYGLSKLLGERRVAEAGGRHLIFRTSWVHAPGGNNFAAKILALAKTRDTLSVIDDQIGAPTSADLIARVTWAAVARHEDDRPLESGVYHLTASGETSWHGYAEKVLALARLSGAKLQCRSIEPVPSSRFETAAKRPKNSRLATGKMVSALGIALPHWSVDVSATVESALRGLAA